MKTPLRLVFPMGLAALMAAVVPASAATLNWTGGALGDGTSWNDSANWGGTAVGFGNDLVIATRNGSGDLPAQDLNNSFTVRSLTFDNSAGRYPSGGLIINASNNTITMDTAGITNISVAANTTVSFNRTTGSTFNIALAEGQNTIDIGANSSLTMGPVSGTASPTGGNFTSAGAATNTFLTKTGDGTLFLGANSLFGGGFTISAGTVVLDGSPAALIQNNTGAVAINGGTLRVKNATAQSGFQRPFQFGSSIGTIDVDSGKTFGLAGAVSNVGSEAGVLRKTGSGLLSMEMGQSQMTMTGGTIVEEGTLRIVAQVNYGGLGGEGIIVKDGGILQAGFASNTQDGGAPPIATTIRGDSAFEQNSRVELGQWASTNTGGFPGGNRTASTGFITFEGNLDISGAADSTLPAFDWTLKAINPTSIGTPGNGTGSDKIIVNAIGTLNIGSGLLEFSDFTFTGEEGVTTGVYTLFQTDNPIIGSLGSSLTGSFLTNTVPLFGTLQLSGDGTDIEFVVTIPEPSTCVLLGLGGLLGFAAWRRSGRARGRP